jgi:hypothetical protein
MARKPSKVYFHIQQIAVVAGNRASAPFPSVSVRCSEAETGPQTGPRA